VLKDKLSVIYETQRGRPSPFRAEYPYMLSVMTDWQDFDIVVWHGAWIGDRPDEQLLAGTADPPHPSHFWTAVHLEHDPVMASALAMAGRLFLGGHVGVAADPALYTVGKQGVSSYAAWNGVGGREMSLRTFTRGSRIEIVPERDCGVLVDGKEPQPMDPPAEAVATGQHVLWDWPNQRLIIDAPTAKVYVGRTVPSYRFKDGITLSGFNTPFVAFSLISADGKPLLGEDACRKAYVNAVFDAKNTGLQFNYAVPGGPVEQANAVGNRGAAPVVVDKVSYTLSFPVALAGRGEGARGESRRQHGCSPGGAAQSAAEPELGRHLPPRPPPAARRFVPPGLGQPRGHGRQARQVHHARRGGDPAEAASQRRGDVRPGPNEPDRRDLLAGPGFLGSHCRAQGGLRQPGPREDRRRRVGAE
jgi:hypothetical protein